MAIYSPAILRTKIIPPERGIRTLVRPRVSSILLQALEYRLTILQAGPGYGKSTALAQLAYEDVPLIWYQVTEEDNDPLTFLSHLFNAAVYAIPDLSNLEGFAVNDVFLAWSSLSLPISWRKIVDQFLNLLSEFFETTKKDLPRRILLVIDDAHLVTDTGDVPLILDRLIGLAPASLHVLLAGRPTISLPTLSRWRAQGDMLLLDQTILIFTPTEISSLFAAHYNLELTQEEVDSLSSYTEGWAIALQLIWQSIRTQTAQITEFSIRPDQLFQVDRKTTSLEMLFEVLAREVFSCQPPDIRDFLLITATLRDLQPDACNAIRGAADSLAMLAYLKRQDLFVSETSGRVLRYHHIFHSFLRQLTPNAQRIQWHLNAAAYFTVQNNSESTIYHLLEAEDWVETASLLDSYAPVLLSSGRLDTLSAYILALPPEILMIHPMLTFTLGEIARLHSRFDEALGWYKQAEKTWRSHRQHDGVARSLRGQARVYLDTVNPTQAEKVLEEAIYLSDGFEDRDSQVRLFELLAENKLNAGQIAESERLRQRADEMRMQGPTSSQLWFRVLLRTGRLNEARRELEIQAEEEKHQPVQTPRAHRETILLLSLIYSLIGLSQEALQTATEGTQRGEELKSPFITAVGYMRQGHARVLVAAHKNDPIEITNILNSAKESYQKCIDISRSLNVSRLLVEANWGLCRLSGYQGDLVNAQNYAQIAIEIAAQAGDEWIASLTRLSLGASLTLAARYEAAEAWLNHALSGFQECSDPFGQTVTRIWLIYGWLKQQSAVPTAQNRLIRLDGTSSLVELLQICQDSGYDFIFLQPSLVGAPDDRIFTPMLLFARDKIKGLDTKIRIYIDNLLEQLGMPGIEFHPGYRLRVQTLGGFQVWLGSEVIPTNGWRREKAKLLFQLLITNRRTPLDRDQICEYLWPEADPAAAQRNFKITLNTLFQVLEPLRDPGSESAYIFRDGTTYILRPNSDINIDSENFSLAIRQWMLQVSKLDPNNYNSRLECLSTGQEAVKIYSGEYLPETLYTSWAAEERERLATLFMESADRLAELAILHGDNKCAIDLCQRILTQDNCWERAYRHLMLAYAHMSDHGQVGRTYQRCVQTLHMELDVIPAPETQALFEKLTH